MSSIVPYDNYGNKFNAITPYLGNSCVPSFSFGSSALSRSFQSQFAYVGQSMAFDDLLGITSASLQLNQSLSPGSESWEASLDFDDLGFELGAAMDFEDLDFSFDL